MENDDVLLGGVRPGDSDGVKVRYYPADGHIKVSFLSRSGREVHSFEVDGIADLESLTDVCARAVLRYRELQGNSHDTYLASVRRVLAPQTENVTATILNAH